MQRNDFNKIIITGTAKNIPKLNKTVNGTPVANFEILSSAKRRSDIFDVTVWGELAELSATLILPDQKLLIEGHIQHRRANDDHFSTKDIVEVVAKRIYSLSENRALGEYNMYEY